jgi:hypothetical protein
MTPDLAGPESVPYTRCPGAVGGSQISAPTALRGTLSTVWSWLRDDARAWSLADRAAVAWLALPVVATVLLAATYLVKPVFRFLTDEDSVIEWSQLAALVAAVVGAAWVTLVLYRRRAHGLAVVFGIMALAAFVVAGEEISWGQRLLRRNPRSAQADQRAGRNEHS